MYNDFPGVFFLESLPPIRFSFTSPGTNGCQYECPLHMNALIELVCRESGAESQGGIFAG
jgi:hypothetical protein